MSQWLTLHSYLAKLNTNMRSQSISILSANIRGFITNVDELSHNFVNTRPPDMIAVIETFLGNIPWENFARIAGYTSLK